MNISAPRLLRALTDFQLRTDKFWAFSKKSKDLNDFATDEFQEYWKYYKELMPFVRDFATQANNEEISRLAIKFCKENFLNVERAMNGASKSRGWLSFFSSSVGMDDFREAFNGTKYTLDNLVYQLKIY